MVAGSGLVSADAGKIVNGSGLVAAGSCWCRKVITAAGKVVAGAVLVACWCRTGSCWCRKVIAAAGTWSLEHGW